MLAYARRESDKLKTQDCDSPIVREIETYFIRLICGVRPVAAACGVRGGDAAAACIWLIL